MVTFTRVSQISGKPHSREIAMDEDKFTDCYMKFMDGTLIQQAFPELNDDDREFIMTGITPEEWDEFVGPERED